MTTQKAERSKEIGRSRVILSQVLACLALDFLLIGLGMSVSFVTMVLPEVLGAKEGLSLTENEASWFGSMAFLCQPLGSIFSGPILDYFGRKKALFIVNIPHLIAWFLMYSAWDVPSLFIANAMLGIGTGIMEAPSITYVGEISDPSIRGILTTLTNSFTSTGMFVAYLLGTVLPWRQAALVSLTVPLATMLLVLFVPETPIWLLSKGRQKDALRSLCRLRGWAEPHQVKEEFDDLVQYNEMSHQCVLCIRDGKSALASCQHTNVSLFTKVRLTFKHILFVRETMRPFVLVLAYFFFHSMAGFVPVRPNMINVCKALGMKYDSKTMIVVIGAMFIVMNLLSVIIVKTIGKRKLVLGSLFASTLCCLSLAVYSGMTIPMEVFSYDATTFPEPNRTLPIVLFFLLVGFHSLGIPWVLLSEVFPFRSRGIATSMAAASGYVIFFLASKTNYNIEAGLHLSGSYILYACLGAFGTIYLYFFLPETENKSLIEIEAYYKGKYKVFADDFFINAIRRKRDVTNDADKPMLVI